MEPKKIKQIFDYLNTQTSQLSRADGAFVFCRADPLVAEKTAELFERGLIDYAMFTGGIGKDSGPLPQLKMPEAVYQAALLQWVYGISDDHIFVESTAQNGAENSEKGIDLIVEKSLPHSELIITIHPTSLRRVHATHLLLAKEKGFQANYQLVGTNYEFNHNNPVDQQEAIGELLKLADWPDKGWCLKQNDLPEELVRYAREVKKEK